MSAQLQPEPSTGETINRRISAAIRALVAANNTGADEMIQRLHMTRSTYYRRLREGDWSAAEVGLLAEHFGVSVADIYAGRLTVICGLLATGLWTPDLPDRRLGAPDRRHLRGINGGRQGPPDSQRALLGVI